MATEVTLTLTLHDVWQAKTALSAMANDCWRKAHDDAYNDRERKDWEELAKRYHMAWYRIDEQQKRGN